MVESKKLFVLSVADEIIDGDSSISSAHLNHVLTRMMVLGWHLGSNSTFQHLEETSKGFSHTLKTNNQGQPESVAQTIFK